MARRQTQTTPMRRQGGSFQRIRALDCFSEVHARIVSGQAMALVRDFIREEKGELLDLKPDSVMRMLYDYKESIPAAARLAAANPSFVQKAVERLDDGVDELDELGKLYQIQLGRVLKAVELEEQNNTLYRSTGPEVRVAAEILDRRAKLKQDLGLTAKQLGSVNVNVSGEAVAIYGDPRFEALLDNPEDVRSLVKIVEGVFGLQAQGVDLPVLDGELVEDDVEADDAP